MSATPLEGDDLVTSLRQLVVSFAPHIKVAGSAERALDAITHLEEYDEKFHRYDYVKGLRAAIESSLSELTDREIEEHSIHPNDTTAGHEDLMSSIIDRVIGSDACSGLVNTLRVNVGVATEKLLENFDDEFASFSSERGTAGHGKAHRGTDVLLYSDEESSLGDSSLNQSSYMFLNTEQFQSIAESIEKKKPIDTRRDAMSSLVRIATLDVQSCEVWREIRQSVQDALVDPDELLSMQSLRFLAKGLSSTDSCIKEMFTTLAEFLSMQFHSVGKSRVPKMKEGLDCTKVENIKLLKAFRLINEFQQNIPQFWVRYSERFLDDILEASISLLAIQPTTAAGTTSHVTPAYFVALIDPKANWFVKWMHGHYSRAPLLKALAKQRNIVDTAVRACVDYVRAEKSPPCSIALPTGENIRMSYTEQELQYMYVVHSLHFIGRLILNKHGRSFFPIKVKDFEEPLTISQFIVCLLGLITKPSVVIQTRSITAQYDPALITAHLVKKLCGSEFACQECLCRDEVTTALLAPISGWLNGSNAAMSVSGTTLYLIAEITSNLATSGYGQQHLLYGETGSRFSRSSATSPASSPSAVVARFTTAALAGRLPPACGAQPSRTVTSRFLFVVRQLYNTCEGLLALGAASGLHAAISHAWAGATLEADQAATPTPSMTSDENDTVNRESQYILLWEETLRDSLLSFCGSPKGVLLLHESGALNESVLYLYTRQASKMQVSRCEKYGYGYMLSLITASAAGISALAQTGYIEDVIRKLWAELEVADDLPVCTQKAWPVDPIDKLVRKSFNSLVHLLSSFFAVYELLYDVALPTKDSYSFREMPQTIEGLLDRLVMVDSPEKISSLFNYEQSHVFGLRLLSILVSCLDTQLLLQTQYSIQEVLLKCQKESITENHSTFIIDMLSLERNYILVKMQLIGGATERRLPPRSLPEGEDTTFPYPLFSSYPIPKEYHCPISGKSAMKKENDLSRYLNESKKVAANVSWLEKCRKAFCSVLTTKPDAATGVVLQELLEKSVDALRQMKEEAVFPLADGAVTEIGVKQVHLSAMQELGIKITLRYGRHLRLITNGKESGEKLALLLKQTACLYQQQQRAAPQSELRCTATSCHGYDWFAATIFLMMNGNQARAWKLIQKLSSVTASAYLSAARLHNSVHVSPSVALSCVPPVLSGACHAVELILQTEVAHVYSAFRMAGYSPAQICQHWVRQCFWNYLDWRDVCHYVCVCVVLGTDYQVYMCAAVLRHLQHAIMTHLQQRDLVVFLKEEAICGFRVGEHLEYMQQLEKKFRSTILPDMLNFSTS